MLKEAPNFNHKYGVAFLEEQPRKIAILRALPGLGDLLCTVPAWRALRAALPDAEIQLVGLPAVEGLVKRFPRYLDGLIEFPGYPGLPERAFDPARFRNFLEFMHAQQFDLAIQMQGSGLVSNPLTAMLGAQHNAGFYLPGQYCPDDARFLPYPAHEPEVCRHLRLMEFLNVSSHGDDLEFPISQQDEEAFQALPEVANLRPGTFVCLHPGASIEARRWSIASFAAIGDALQAQGFKVLLTGSASERPLTEAVAGAMQATSLNLAGKTNLGALAVLLTKSRLLVSNDTGVSHLAAALRVPSVVIFIASDPMRWSPLNRQRHRIVVGPNAERNPCVHSATDDCQRCLRDGCTITKRQKATSLTDVAVYPTVSEVWEQVDKLLRKESIYAD